MSLPDSRIKVDRVSSLRHDIMNPLTVILGYVKILSGRGDLPPEAARYVSRIQDEARRCIEIFDADKARHDNLVETAGSPASADVDAVAARDVTILVVDDDRGIRSLSCEVIEWGLKDSKNYDSVSVLVAESAEAARKLAAENHLDAVVMDLNIGRPGGGIELVAELDSLAPGMAKRTVFVSGGILDLQTGDRLEAMDITMLQKPFSIHDLVRGVQHALSR